jgi:hypothetical protein
LGGQIEGVVVNEPLDAFAEHHLLYGESLLRGMEADLKDNRPLWERLWRQEKNAVGAKWKREQPGTRPPVWYEFDRPRAATQRGNEREPEFLHRIGQLKSDELRAMWDHLLAVVRHNQSESWEERRSGRASGGRFCGSDMDQPYSDQDRFALAHPIELTPEERELVAGAGCSLDQNEKTLGGVARGLDLGADGTGKQCEQDRSANTQLAGATWRHGGRAKPADGGRGRRRRRPRSPPH